MTMILLLMILVLKQWLERKRETIIFIANMFVIVLSVLWVSPLVHGESVSICSIPMNIEFPLPTLVSDNVDVTWLAGYDHMVARAPTIWYPLTLDESSRLIRYGPNSAQWY